MKHRTKNFTAAEVIHRTEDFPEELLPIAYAAMGYLQALRDQLGVAIYITSGYRSPEYNAEIGGTENSYHKWRFGGVNQVIWAVDFYSPEMEIGYLYEELAKIVEGEMYWNRAKGFIHLAPHAKKEHWIA